MECFLYTAFDLFIIMFDQLFVLLWWFFEEEKGRLKYGSSVNRASQFEKGLTNLAQDPKYCVVLNTL